MKGARVITAIGAEIRIAMLTRAAASGARQASTLPIPLLCRRTIAGCLWAGTATGGIGFAACARALHRGRNRLTRPVAVALDGPDHLPYRHADDWRNDAS